MSDGKRVLVVANQTAASEPLVEVVRRRAQGGASAFHLVVPAEAHGLSRMANPDEAPREEAQARLEEALAALSAVAGGARVTGEVGCAEPLAAIQDAVHAASYDEIVISTLPRRLSRWLHLDLPHKAAGLGLPVTHVRADGEPVELPPAGSRTPA